MTGQLDKTFDYEVAFSFLQQDENLAFEINDLIQDRYNTFIYSEHQKEIAGTDGEMTFNDIFSNKSRIVVVLFREKWGNTRWTRIEETAIRGRAHDEGYDFTVFVQIDKESILPKWVPKTRIYYNLERWGVKGLAPVIESKIHEFGGQSRPETLEDKTLRIKRIFLMKHERQKYLSSPQAYTDAQREFDKLFELLEKKTKSLEDPEISLYFGYDKSPSKEFVVRFANYSAHFSWSYAYSNSLEDSSLLVSISAYKQDSPKDFLERHAFGRPSGERPVKRQEYNFDINITTQEKGWSKKDKQQEFIASENLMLEWLGDFMDQVKKIKLS